MTFKIIAVFCLLVVAFGAELDKKDDLKTENTFGLGYSGLGGYEHGSYYPSYSYGGYGGNGGHGGYGGYGYSRYPRYCGSNGYGGYPYSGYSYYA